MTLRISGLIARGLLGVALAMLLSACSKPDGKRILGRWRAEPLQLQGIRVPIGPEFVVGHHELRSLDGAIDIPLSSITEKDDKITLDMTLGLGLTFQFEGNDRMSFEVPLVGQKIYYRRVSDATSIAHSRVEPSPAHRAVTAPPFGSVQLSREAESAAHVSAVAAPPQAERQQSNDPMVDYNQSILHMRRGDADAAVRSLRDAFEHGFRDFQLLETSQDLVQLRSDPRYNALVTRYR